ncbi:MAG: DUF4116 domain-containing protein [Desulfovibrio sp.]|nr:DUF4116 domain-containing protein [Desulfovibrio sp.]
MPNIAASSSLDTSLKELRMPELCMEAVRRNGATLRFVPKELKTPDMCTVAVESAGEAVKFVPPPLRTPELCFKGTMNEVPLDDIPKCRRSQSTGSAERRP